MSIQSVFSTSLISNEQSFKFYCKQKYSGSQINSNGFVFAVDKYQNVCPA